MNSFDRREFLRGLGTTGALLAAGPWLHALGYAQTSRSEARVFLRRSATRADFDRRVTWSQNYDPFGNGLLSRSWRTWFSVMCYAYLFPWLIPG